MLNKAKFTKFIDKFHLSGTNDKVYIESDDKNTFVKCVNEDVSLISNIFTNPLFTAGDGFGIFDVTQFTKLINLFNSESIDSSFQKENEKNAILMLANKDVALKYMLADEEVIPRPPGFKAAPVWNYEMKIEAKTATDIIKSLEATGTKIVYFVIEKDDKITLHIGDIKSKDSIVTITLASTTNEPSSTEQISFNSQYLKYMLNVNKSGTIKLDMRGLMNFENEEEGIQASYFQSALIDE